MTTARYDIISNNKQGYNNNNNNKKNNNNDNNNNLNNNYYNKRTSIWLGCDIIVISLVRFYSWHHISASRHCIFNPPWITANYVTYKHKVITGLIHRNMTTRKPKSNIFRTTFSMYIWADIFTKAMRSLGIYEGFKMKLWSWNNPCLNFNV